MSDSERAAKGWLAGNTKSMPDNDLYQRDIPYTNAFDQAKWDRLMAENSTTWYGGKKDTTPWYGAAGNSSSNK